MISKSSKVLLLLMFFSLSSSSSSSSWWWSWMKVTVVGITATTIMSGGIIGVTSFQPHPIYAGKKPLLLPSSSTAVSLDVVGYVVSIFSGGQEEKQQQKNNNNKSSDLNPPSAAATTTTLEPWMRISQIMETMTDMESAQKASRLASVLLQDLKSNTIVEGLSPNGKIKVYFDGQQKPLEVVIEKEGGGGGGGVADDDNTLDLATSITLAMQDAHHKSIEKMDEKIKNLYADLGFLPPP